MPFATRHSPNQYVNHILSRIIAISCLMTLLYAMPVFADDYSDVSKLTQSGQYGEALSKANAYLVQQPKDAQMRFMKGLILTEQNKQAEAIVVFTKLTEDFPRLPEPYNNLAVLFASTNQYEKSRAALEMAIRTNPTYATAHENLGDVYAKLASQAYDKALQLDTNNTAAKSKLTLIRSLVNSTTAATPHKNGTIAALTTKSAAAPTASIAATMEKPAPIVLPETTKKAHTKIDANTKVAVAKAESATSKPSVDIELKSASKDKVEVNGIINTIDKWASAWSEQDMKGYLAAYSNDFQPPQGISRKAWSQERRARIEGKNRISIKVTSPKVTINGDLATVKFRQSYKSNNFTSDSSKTLLMTKQDGKWHIKQERTGN